MFRDVSVVNLIVSGVSIKLLEKCDYKPGISNTASYQKVLTTVLTAGCLCVAYFSAAVRISVALAFGIFCHTILANVEFFIYFQVSHS